VPWRFLDAGQLSLRSLLVAGVQKPAQSEKNSVRVYVFRFALKLGHCPTQPALRFCADSVEKVRAAVSPNFLRAAGAF
jgi:hypothetical protein